MKATKREISDMINYLSRSTNTEPTEPLPEEEEESPYTDNTGNRDNIINAQPGDYNAWINGLNGLDVSAPSIHHRFLALILVMKTRFISKYHLL